MPAIGTADRLGGLALLMRVVTIAGLTLWLVVGAAPRLARPLASGDRRAVLRVIGGILAALAESLGPVFLKIGQWLSVRADLLPEPMIVPLRRLQDAVRPAPWPHVAEELRAALGSDVSAVFDEFDPVPIASGSVAQVYRARLADGGQTVAVKVRRPGIERRLNIDLTVIVTIGRWLARRWPELPIVSGLEQMVQMMRMQTDLIREAETCASFRQSFRHRCDVRFPEPIWPLCTRGVLVMTFFDGLEKIDSSRLPVEVFRRAIDVMLRVLYEMVFLQGVIHCDLHPGNILVDRHGSVVLLDMGLSARLSDRERDAFRAFFLALVSNDGERCARIVEQVAARRTARFDPLAFRREIRTLVTEVQATRAGHFLVAGFVWRLFEAQRHAGLIGSADFTLVIAALMSFEGLARARYPDLDFQSPAKPFFAAAAVQRLRRFGIA